MIVLRPADANEVVEAWRVIMRIKDRPVSLVLTRQALATLDRTKYAPASGVSRGAYVLADVPDHRPLCCCWRPVAKSRSALLRMNN